MTVWLPGGSIEFFLLEDLLDDLLLVVEPRLQLLHIKLLEVEGGADGLAQQGVEPGKQHHRLEHPHDRHQ
jgi:hypothetical protein